MTAPIPFIFSPLAINQERLWFLYQLNTLDTSYNMALALRIEGALNAEKLFMACEQVIQRQPSLRTVFAEEHDKVISVIKPNSKLIPVIIKKIIPVALIDEDIKQELAKLNQTPFDLIQGPLCRHILLEYREDLHVLLFSVHHIIYDGQSFILHLNEIAQCYDALLHHQKINLPNLTHQYVDFVSAQKLRLDAAEKDRILNYWKKRLSGISPLELPTDKPRTNINIDIQSKRFIMSDQQAKQCMEFTQRQNKSLFTLLFSVFCILLYRYSGQNDFVIGVPTHGRYQNEYKNVIGFFVNMLPMRVQLAPNMTFNELMSAVKTDVRSALMHQEISLPTLVAELHLPRRVNHDPIFQVLFEIDDSPLTDIHYENINMTLVATESDKAPYDLVFEVHTHANKIILNINYDANLFFATSVERMLTHWCDLLSASMTNPDQMISQLSMLTAVEYQTLVINWNKTEKPFPNKTIHQLFEEQVELFPDRLAIADATKSYTYHEVNQQANQLAHYLQSIGITSNVIVGLCLSRGVEMLVYLLGIMKAGAAYLILDPAFPEERLLHELQETQAPLLLTRQKYGDKFKNYNNNIFFLEEQSHELQRFPTTSLANHSTLDQLAYVIYTSGSTGKPKGVLLKQRGLVNLVNWYHTVLHISKTDRSAQFASVSFDAMGCEVWPFLTSGGSVHVVDDNTRLDPDLLMNWLIQNKITVCDLPTVVANIILTMDWPVKTALRLLKIGGEKVGPLPHKTFPFAIWNTYGPTEATIECIATQINTLSQTLPAIGKPIQNVQVYILDAALQPVPVGVLGELYIGGVGVAEGYLQQPELTSQRFIANPFGVDRLYRTGDICRYLSDGNIEFIKRADNQIKLHGYRIELNEIQTMIKNHAAIKDAVVLLKEFDQGEKKLIVYWIATNPNNHLEVSELQHYLQHALPSFMIPSTYIRIDKFPLTPSGKIDNNALLALEIPTKHATLLPKTKTEHELATIWCDVLQLKQINLTDNFFAMGGNSLNSMQLVAKIKKTFKTTFSLADLFINQTVAEQARVIGAESKPPISVPLTTQTHLPILFCLHPVNGQVSCYLSLANAIKNHFAVWALQYPDSAYYPRFSSVEELAKFYLLEIQKIQKKGPYALLGWSTGGLLAFELAKQIHSIGEKVSLLAMIDTHHPASVGKLIDFDNRFFLWNLLNILLPFTKKSKWWHHILLLMLYYRLVPLSLFAWLLGVNVNMKATLEALKSDFSQSGPDQLPLAKWIAILQEKHYLSEEIDPHQFKILYSELRDHFLMAEKYVPAFYSGEMLLFTTRSPFFPGRWEACCQRVIQIKLPVNHYQAIKDFNSLQLIVNTLIARGGDE